MCFRPLMQNKTPYLILETHCFILKDTSRFLTQRVLDLQSKECTLLLGYYGASGYNIIWRSSVLRRVQKNCRQREQSGFLRGLFDECLFAENTMSTPGYSVCIVRGSQYSKQNFCAHQCWIALRYLVGGHSQLGGNEVAVIWAGGHRTHWCNRYRECFLF